MNAWCKRNRAEKQRKKQHNREKKTTQKKKTEESQILLLTEKEEKSLQSKKLNYCYGVCVTSNSYTTTRERER